jgi:integrase
MIVVAIQTGLRRGEQCHLRWEHVEFATGLITVPRSKSGETRRVPMNDTVREVLRGLPNRLRSLRDGQGRASRPFNPAASSDLSLFAAVLRGEHLLQGLRNCELRLRLFGPAAVHDRRRSAHVSRLLKRMHLRGSSPRSLARAAGASPSSVTAVMTTAVLLRGGLPQRLSQGGRLTPAQISARYGEVGQRDSICA